MGASDKTLPVRRRTKQRSLPHPALPRKKPTPPVHTLEYRLPPNRLGPIHLPADHGIVVTVRHSRFHVSRQRETRRKHSPPQHNNRYPPPKLAQNCGGAPAYPPQIPTATNTMIGITTRAEAARTANTCTVLLFFSLFLVLPFTLSPRPMNRLFNTRMDTEILPAVPIATIAAARCESSPANRHKHSQQEEEEEAEREDDGEGGERNLKLRNVACGEGGGFGHEGRSRGWGQGGRVEVGSFLSHDDDDDD
ncbi:hypothetical protein VTI28DRAFT_7888 [Corynascus sepedonium]